MKDERRNLSGGIACFVLFAVITSGCTWGDAGADNGVSTQSSPPRESQIDRVEQSDGQPTAVITTDGRRVAFKNGEATVGDMMAIATSGGEVEYHRTPSSIMAELSRSQVAYLVEGTGFTGGTGGLVYYEGLEGNPRVHAESGKLCWMAVACKNEACPGNTSQDAPNVFSFRESGYSVNADGKVVRPDPSTAARRPSTTLPCPTCNSRDFLEPYRPTDIAERRAQLEADLAASRAARTRIAKP